MTSLPSADVGRYVAVVEEPSNARFMYTDTLELLGEQIGACLDCKSPDEEAEDTVTAVRDLETGADLSVHPRTVVMFR